MNKDIARGKAQQAEGKVKEKAGKATGDTSLEIRGAAERLEGKLREGFGKMKQDIEKAAKE